jgi:hypothetical protein
MGVVFDGEQGRRHCKDCDSPELFPGEINQYGYCFGCSDGNEEYGKPNPYQDAKPDQDVIDRLNNDARQQPGWLRSGRHG